MKKLCISTILCLMLKSCAQRNGIVGGENIALGKKTQQSSDYTDQGFTYSSYLSVDGNKDGDFNHKSCSSTDPNGPRPAWWSVDLGENRILKKIIIFNRKRYTSRLRGARVQGFTKDGTMIQIDSTSNYDQDTIQIDANIDKYLRNVTIVLEQSSNPENIINICEVEIYAREENIALSKNTKQSSDFNDGSFTFSSDLSVDGNENMDFSNKSCSSTDLNGPRPAWWSVDLGEDRMLKKIIIFNRKGYTRRLLGARVLGFTSNGAPIEIDSTANYTEDIITVDANIGRLIRNVTIILGRNTHNTDNIINICEVEIYADVNIALGKITRQSSSYSDGGFTFSSDLSVDGNKNTDFSNKSCSSTGSNEPWPAWWSVDLGEDKILKKIIIFNRKGYTYRLNGARVLGFTKNGTETEIDSTANFEQNIVTIDVNVYRFFRNVTIVLRNIPNTQNIINICEVEIYAAITCPIPPAIPDNSDSSCTPGIEGTFMYNSSVQINCHEGYKLQGTGAIRCTVEGSWSHTSFGTCVAITCPILHMVPENSFLSYMPGIAGNWTYNSSVKINCREGYELNGTATVRCTINGTWSDTRFGSCSAITCPILPTIPENSEISYISGVAGNLTYNSSMKINCREGYTLLGTGTIRCIGNGTWSDRSFGSCFVITCPIPPMFPENSESNCIPGISGNSTYNSSVQISCREGYNLQGNKITAIRCTEEGTWSDTSFGICSVTICPIPPKIPENSDSSYVPGIEGNSTYNSSVNITCHEGYKIQGTGTIRCIDGGTWSEETFGICSATVCSTPPTVPSHSMLTSIKGITCNMSYNSTLTITCEDGFELIGLGSVRCTEEGHWSAANFGSCNGISVFN